MKGRKCLLRSRTALLAGRARALNAGTVAGLTGAARPVLAAFTALACSTIAAFTFTARPTSHLLFQRR